MPRQRFSSGSSFEAAIGYSRAVADGDWVFVSGTTGFDYPTMTIDDDLEAQTVQCLRNIEAALAQASATLADVVRVTYLLAPGRDFSRCWPALRAAFDTIRPAATMMTVGGFADPRIAIEIEVTARRPASASPG